MKTKLLLFSALAFLMLSFNGCTPDEVVTAQEQFKTLIIRATLATPISQPTAQPANLESFAINGIQGLSGSVPSQVGQNTIEYQTTATPNTPIALIVSYLHCLGMDNNAILSWECNTVSLEIIYDGQTVFNQSKEMGSNTGSCTDGIQWNVNYTLQ